jgi:ribosome recycling factor
MWNTIVKDIKDRMEKAVEHTQGDLAKVRTGRANPTLLDGIRVNYYGALTPLKQLATISVPEPRMMMVQPFDASCVADVNKAIQTADMGLTPQLEGKLIRVPVPPLSTERRADLVKLVKKIAEDGRISLRAIRRDGNDQIKKSEKDKDITEDDRDKALDQIQKITDEKSKALDSAAENKEQELTTV